MSVSTCQGSQGSAMTAPGWWVVGGGWRVAGGGGGSLLASRGPHPGRQHPREEERCFLPSRFCGWPPNSTDTRQRKTEEQEKNFNFVHMGVGHRNRRLPKCPKPLKQMIIYGNR